MEGTKLLRPAYGNPLRPLASAAPTGVLLYSPNLLRFITASVYVLVLVSMGLFLTSWDPAHQDSRMLTARLVMLAVATLVMVGVWVAANRHYVACVLLTTLLSLTSGLANSAYMYGLDTNPHVLIALWFLLFAGFTLGRRGLLWATGCIAAIRLLLQIAEAWGWWPAPTSIPVAFVRHENLSALIIMGMMTFTLLLYFVSVMEKSLTNAKQRAQSAELKVLQLEARLRDLERPTP
jgi:hypothetical protein